MGCWFWFGFFLIHEYITLTLLINTEMISTKIKGHIQKSGGRVGLEEGKWVVQKAGSNASLGLAWMLYCYPAALSVYILNVCRLFRCSGLAFLRDGRVETPREREFQKKWSGHFQY